MINVHCPKCGHAQTVNRYDDNHRYVCNACLVLWTMLTDEQRKDERKKHYNEGFFHGRKTMLVMLADQLVGLN